MQVEVSTFTRAVTYFPVLDTDYMFSRAWHRVLVIAWFLSSVSLYAFPHFKPDASFCLQFWLLHCTTCFLWIGKIRFDIETTQFFILLFHNRNQSLSQKIDLYGWCVDCDCFPGPCVDKVPNYPRQNRRLRTMEMRLPTSTRLSLQRVQYLLLCRPGSRNAHMRTSMPATLSVGW